MPTRTDEGAAGFIAPPNGSLHMTRDVPRIDAGRCRGATRLVRRSELLFLQLLHRKLEYSLDYRREIPIRDLMPEHRLRLAQEVTSTLAQHHPKREAFG